jgi:serine/threonine-protein kinase TTK/MPS1
MECGEIDFSMLLDEQRGKPLNFNFVGLYWQQVSPLTMKAVCLTKM